MGPPLPSYSAVLPPPPFWLGGAWLIKGLAWWCWGFVWIGFDLSPINPLGGPIVLLFWSWSYLVPLSCLLSNPLTAKPTKVWGFPLFVRVLGWFYSGNQLLETLGLVLSCPLIGLQPMAKGSFLFFYILNWHFFKLLMKSLSNQLSK